MLLDRPRLDSSDHLTVGRTDRMLDCRMPIADSIILQHTRRSYSTCTWDQVQYWYRYCAGIHAFVVDDASCTGIMKHSCRLTIGGVSRATVQVSKTMRSLWLSLFSMIPVFQGASGFVNSPSRGVVIIQKNLRGHDENPAFISREKKKLGQASSKARKTKLSLLLVADPSSSIEMTSLLSSINLNVDRDQAEALAGPFFGASLFPYLAFLYFLNVEENECPKGVTVGFATCLLFVFLTIPAAIAAQLLYGVSLADSDWLHGSAESLLTITNLVTVVAFRQALNAKEKDLEMPPSATSWAPMTWLVGGLTVVAVATALVPAASGATVHTPYLAGFMDLPFTLDSFGANPEPENALTIATWIIHISSLVEFLVAMGFAWRWGDIVQNPTWKGLTWGLIPLHSSGITACTYHLFYNQIPILVPFQAMLTCVGNTTAAFAAYRIARSNGWKPNFDENVIAVADKLAFSPSNETPQQKQKEESESLVGFEDLGAALAGDTDYTFLIKLFVGCAVASYAIKYGEIFFDFPYEANIYLGFAVIGIPSALNAFKWYKRSQDPTFEGWF